MQYKTPLAYSKDVVNLQLILNGLNYNCGKADGLYGKTVETCVKKFQTDHKLPADGKCGDKTWAALFVDVKAIQNKLNSLGFKCGTADGYFGANTTNALKNYQKSKGLKETGICDNETKNKLFSQNANANGNDNANANGNSNANANNNANDNANNNNNANTNNNNNANTNNNSNTNTNNVNNVNTNNVDVKNTNNVNVVNVNNTTKNNTTSKCTSPLNNCK